MPWLERDPSGYYHVAFRFGDCRFKRSLRTKKKNEAEARRIRLEENTRLVESGRLTIPDGADPATFLLSDGKLEQGQSIPRSLRLAKLCDDYHQSLPDGTMEANSLYTAAIHMHHLERGFGPNYHVRELKLEDLQKYVARRSKQKGTRGRPVSPTTVKKELTTFSSVWNWARLRGYVDGPFPNKGLRYPKTVEKPPFQTWRTIERQIMRGGLSQHEQNELWGCLFLSLEEITELLAHIKKAARQPFLHPMCFVAAHTGARRSEILRSETNDFDIEGSLVVIREKKRARGRRTTRIIPLSPALRDVMSAWLGSRPAIKHAFSRNSDTSVYSRSPSDHMPISVDESSRCLKQALRGSRWEKIRGWHIFRHSFISNCAARGVDQRMIDAWSGHQTEEMRRRYTHLFPDTQHDAIRLALGES